MTIEEIFMIAVEKQPAERPAYLDVACSGDEALRSRVERLMLAHEMASNVLEQPLFQETPASEDTRTGPDAADHDISLDFLTPSVKPGSLGRLGHHEVQAVVGRGGMGVVLKAFDESLHRVVAIKVLAPQLASSATARQRFTREARAAAAVAHEHVVTIHAVDEAGGLPYLVMQYVDGVSLQERIDRSGPMRLVEVLRIGMQAASGLAAAHKQGLVHRDVKPANALLENGVERVKLTDFGLARAADDSNLTQAGAVAGTPQYMSPEQAEGLPVDARSDLFSFGSVLYAMCTGVPPFRGSTARSVLKRVVEDAPPSIREANPEAPEWLIELIGKLHAKDPATRFQSAEEVADILGQKLAELRHPPMVTTPSAIVEVAPTTRSRRRWAIAATVLAFATAGLGMTEAAGVTKVRSTVVRIFTRDGILVVELDDPDVKVSVEGNGDLVISGAGVREVRLPPGTYRLRAMKDGKPVTLDRDLVSITRGDTQVVRVRLEVTTPNVMPPKRESEAFVVFGVEGTGPRKFDTLAEAVNGASNGDTIEIRGNGPFDTHHINFARLNLTIRAAQGYRPVIRSATLNKDGAPLFSGGEAITMEGLELHDGQNSDQPLTWTGGVLISSPTSLHAVNCRFQGSGGYNVWSYPETRRCVLRNCEFYSNAVAGTLAGGGEWRIDNCVVLGAIFTFQFNPERSGASVRLHRVTCVGGEYAAAVWTELFGESLVRPALRMDVSASVLDARCSLQLNQAHKRLPDAEYDALVRRMYTWRGDRNQYGIWTGGPDEKVSFRAAHNTTADTVWRPGPGDLAGWKAFWNATEKGSIEGRPSFRGGELLTRYYESPRKLIAEDFRLTPDSKGYRAGEDGKDLGADIDLVGPGRAYEWWKATPEYQVWLKETGRAKK